MATPIRGVFHFSVQNPYMEGSFGNIVEIYSHSYEQTYSVGAYQ